MGRTIYTPEHRHLVAVLRKLREDTGLTQVELARSLGRPQSFVSKYEAGERRLDVIELREIGAALGVGLVELVTQYEGSLPKQKGRPRSTKARRRVR